MPRTIEMNLSKASIMKACKELTKYRNDLNRKSHIFAKRLADLGIEVAKGVADSTDGERYGGHCMGDFVVFKKEIESSDKDGCTVLMCGYGTPFVSTWYTQDGVESWTIYPLSMLEWGSGAFYDPKGEEFGNSRIAQSGHENDTDWWVVKDYTTDEHGRDVAIWTHATAIEPTKPMYTAWESMKESIVSIAKDVYGGE